MSLALPIASYRLDSPAASSTRLLNVYAEQAPKDSTKGPVILRRAPGITEWADVGTGPIRCMTLVKERLFALSGASLYELFWDGSSSVIPGVVPGSERVQVSNNGQILVIVRPLGSGYSYDVEAGGSVTQITDTTYTGYGASGVDFLDGYFVFRAVDSNIIFNTGINELTFNALDFVDIDGRPDNLNGLMVDHRELFLPGTVSAELWYNAALPVGSPFSRTSNGLMEIGCAAQYSLAKQDNAVFWLADDLTVRRLQGTTPVRVSQHAIEGLIQNMTRRDDAFGLSYTQEGHLFYVLTFPHAGKTFVYDVTTQEWHERESYGYHRWRPNYIINAFGHQLAGDSESGKIGILDSKTHMEWDEPQRVVWAYQPVFDNDNRMIHRRFELGLNSGHGTTAGQGQNPQVTLKVSDDGGETFEALPMQSLGVRGDYTARAVWWNLGSAYERVYQVEVSDPVPLFVTTTRLDAEGCQL